MYPGSYGFALPVMQSDPFHPSSQVHVFGEEHSMLVLQLGLQIASKLQLLHYT